jgi:hypothetical protein
MHCWRSTPAPGNLRWWNASPRWNGSNPRQPPARPVPLRRWIPRGGPPKLPPECRPTSAGNGLGACERCNYVKNAAGWHIVTAEDDTGTHTADFHTPTGAHYRSTAPPRAPTMTISELEVRVCIALAQHAA